MTKENRELQKSLMEAKERIVNGDVKQGTELIGKVVNSSNIREANWVICNIIDAAECKYVVETLESIGKIFDITTCGNLKRVVTCHAMRGVLNEYVDIALGALVKRRREDLLDRLAQELMNADPKFLVKLASAYGELGNTRKQGDLLRAACEKGLTEACRNINQVYPRLS